VVHLHRTPKEIIMGVTVDVYTWPQVVLAPGAVVTLIHWVVDGNGHSLIDPDRWYWMSAVPQFEGVRPDRPVPAATIEIVSQRPVRDRRIEPGPNNTNWLVTWRNPGNDTVWFQPRMVEAPAR
jgi:hypothetical protein